MPKTILITGAADGIGRALAQRFAAAGYAIIGPTRTAHARRYSPDNRREHRRMPPERLADLIFQAVLTRRRTLIPGVGNRLFAALGTYLLWLTAYAMRKTLFEKLPPEPRSPGTSSR